MPESHWRRNYTIGLIAAGAFALGAAGLLWKSAAESERAIQQAADQQAGHYANPANIPVEGRCPELAPPNQYQCITTERETAREGQRSERDLQAQQAMAVWTRAMGIAAIIGMGVGIFGLGLIFTTFRETRRSAEVAQDNLSAYRAAERGRVRINDVRVDVSDGVLKISPTIAFEVENVGKSDVLITGVKATIAKRTEWAVDGASYVRTQSTYMKVGEKEWLTTSLTPPDVDPAMLANGFVEYETLGQPQRKSHFSFLYWQHPENGKPRYRFYAFNLTGIPRDT